LISNKVKYEQYKPKKFLGQNFLVDENIARKIVASLDVKNDDTVIEIGPGQGVLTKYLTALTENFIAVEIDKSIYEKLIDLYKSKIKIIHKDFLKIDFKAEFPSDQSKKKKLKVIGNIPYNITTEILFKLYDFNLKLESAVLMMQKEVAQRIIAKPNSKDYGILAIQTQVHSSPKILFDVPPTSFFPKPRVFSSIVKFDFTETKYQISDKNIFKALVRESFGQRRKTMKNSLKKYFEKGDFLFEDFDFDFSRRAESVSIEEFVELANKLTL